MAKKRPSLCLNFFVALLGGLLAAPQPSFADNGPTQEGQVCLQKIFGTPVTNSNKVNCTANDIRISRAISVSPTTCIEGTTFDLTATFETIVTANARYDAGFIFRIDGGANARGDGTNATGECSLSALDGSLAPSQNLDGDTCGDLNAGTYNLTFKIPGVLCQDTDGDGFLNLPNCTSWHSNQGTSCNTTPTFAGTDFHPDTKSKCVCDDKFQVPVIVQTPSGSANKTAVKALITYEVSVNNTGNTDVTIESIVDDVYGDVADPSNTKIKSTTCDALLGTTVAQGTTSASCQFTSEYANPGTAGVVANIVTAHLKATTAPFTEVDVTGTTAIDVNLSATP